MEVLGSGSIGAKRLPQAARGGGLKVVPSLKPEDEGTR